MGLIVLLLSFDLLRRRLEVISVFVDSLGWDRSVQDDVKRRVGELFKTIDAMKKVCSMGSPILGV